MPYHRPPFSKAFERRRYRKLAFVLPIEGLDKVKSRYFLRTVPMLHKSTFENCQSKQIVILGGGYSSVGLIECTILFCPNLVAIVETPTMVLGIYLCLALFLFG